MKAEVSTPAELTRALKDPAVNHVALGPGTFPPFTVRRPDLSITGAGVDRTVLDGKDARSAEYGIRAHDNSHGLHLAEFSLTRCGHGTRITNSERVVLTNLKSHHHAGEGLQGGGCDNLLIQDVETSENGWKGRERELDIPQFGAHGTYFSGRGVVVRRLRSFGNGGCGAQCRGSDWLIEDSTLKDNLIGAGVGAPDLQILVNGCRILRCLLTSLTLHKDGGDAASEVVLEESTVYGVRRFACNVTPGLSAPHLLRSIMLGRRTGAAVQQDMDSEVFDRDPGGLVDEALRSLVAVGWGGSAAPAPEPPPAPTDWQARALAAEAELARVRGSHADAIRLMGEATMKLAEATEALA